MAIFAGIFAVMMYFTGMIMGAYIVNGDKLEECQKDLPRDEYCVMIAIPEKTIMEDNE